MNSRTAAAEEKGEAAQLVLPLPRHPPRYDRDAFLIAPTNDAAWRAAEAWLASADPSLIICGPPGSGKTHLATILAENDGWFIDWPDEAATPPPDAKIAIIDRLPADDPRLFLSMLEELTSAGLRTVLVGRGHPGEWAMGFQDLRTRLEAIPRASLDQPDEALLRAVISKAFGDRQIAVDAAVVEYAAPRLPRTFAAALAFVERADEEAARRKKKITVALAKEIVTAFEAAGAAALTA